jgi:hypothetical protein
MTLLRLRVRPFVLSQRTCHFFGAGAGKKKQSSNQNNESVIMFCFQTGINDARAVVRWADSLATDHQNNIVNNCTIGGRMQKRRRLCHQSDRKNIRSKFYRTSPFRSSKEYQRDINQIIGTFIQKTDCPHFPFLLL